MGEKTMSSANRARLDYYARQRARLFRLKSPQDVIESRELHVAERIKSTAFLDVASPFHRACVDEIERCRREIARAKEKIQRGESDPYEP